mmetsp:Transcript_32316/g.36829  ORF Transcript_32316/g.36829 Transcript_32316/m.36829 type:complete len:274 (+) Transcript_32316:87-908(+)
MTTVSRTPICTARASRNKTTSLPTETSKNSGDQDGSHSDSASNVLRRSERNQNHQSSYHAFNRRSFKYDDDFEYTGAVGLRKDPIKMDPPVTSGGVKRKKKNTGGTPQPFTEGLKRAMSAKTPSLASTLMLGENPNVTYNQGRWTSLEHFKFLEALKMFGKEWQKVQQHVSTRTSTQARSHAQKFFVKLDKKSLTLEEFLKDLDLKEVEQTLLAAGMDNTDYDEEREVDLIASRKHLRGSVMNIALPSNSGMCKTPETHVMRESPKRQRSDAD